MNLIELIREKEKMEERLAIVAAEIASIDEKIFAIVGPVFEKERLAHGKDTGTLSLFLDGVEVKQNLPKIVKWDQCILKGLWEKIKASGDKPENYMDQKFNISETAYGKFPDGIKKAFDPAREVKTGKPKLTFEVLPF